MYDVHPPDDTYNYYIGKIVPVIRQPPSQPNRLGCSVWLAITTPWPPNGGLVQRASKGVSEGAIPWGGEGKGVVEGQDNPFSQSQCYPACQ